MRKPTLALLASMAAVVVSATGASAQTSSRVSSGSPSGNTPQNHQNEPAVALDANTPNILVAGSNDFVDEQACPRPLAVNGGTCLDRATGVGVSGVYFSFNSGHTWTQPAYTGWTTADCDPLTPCKGHAGPIHTLPWYSESQLVSFGDPAVAVGPVPGSDGTFSWGNGERVYYANLTTAFSTQVEFSFPNPVFNGFVGIAASRLDNPTPASVINKSSWQPPVIVTSTQGQTSFYDKEQIWADNASSSVYICANDFRSNGSHKNGNAPVPMQVFSSTDGGSSWTKRGVTSAATNGLGPNDFGYSGCTIRTDSAGVVYLFAERFANPAITGLPTHSAQVMFKSFDGGLHWTAPSVIANVTDPCYFIDPVYGRCVMDGYAGARTDLAASPSVSIANGAPTGAGATNEIVDAWADAPVLNGEVANFIYSTDAGASWSTPTAVSAAGTDRCTLRPPSRPTGRAHTSSTKRLRRRGLAPTSTRRARTMACLSARLSDRMEPRPVGRPNSTKRRATCLRPTRATTCIRSVWAITSTRPRRTATASASGPLRLVPLSAPRSRITASALSLRDTEISPVHHGRWPIARRPSAM